jgi:hypothetical protein
LIYRELTVGTGFHMEVRNTGVLFIEKVGFALKRVHSVDELMWLFISADELHVHPSQCSLGTRSFPVDFRALTPRR